MTRSSDTAPLRTVSPRTVSAARGTSGRKAVSPDTGTGLTLARFSAGERLLHWAGAGLIMVCGGSAVALSSLDTSSLARHHALLVAIHVASGYALGLVLAAGLGSAAFRADIRALSRVTAEDRAWLRVWGRRTAGVPVGKFNARQKVQAALTGGALLVLLGTGALLYGPGHPPSAWRVGAGWVHEGAGMLLGTLVLWHVLLVLRDPVSLVGMIRGRVSYAWARRTHDRWAAECVLRAMEDGTYAGPAADAPRAEPSRRPPAARPPAARSAAARPAAPPVGVSAAPPPEAPRPGVSPFAVPPSEIPSREVPPPETLSSDTPPSDTPSPEIPPRVVLPRYPTS